MPVFERLYRSIEQHVAQRPVEVAYVRGKHAGEDAARKQVATIVAVATLVVVLISIFIG